MAMAMRDRWRSGEEKLRVEGGGSRGGGGVVATAADRKRKARTVQLWQLPLARSRPTLSRSLSLTLFPHPAPAAAPAPPPPRQWEPANKGPVGDISTHSHWSDTTPAVSHFPTRSKYTDTQSRDLSRPDRTNTHPRSTLGQRDWYHFFMAVVMANKATKIF